MGKNVAEKTTKWIFGVLHQVYIFCILVQTDDIIYQK